VSDFVLYVPLLAPVAQSFEAMTGKRCVQVPHAWNDTLFRARTRQLLKGEEPLKWSPTLRRTLQHGARVTIFVWEPSVSVVKTSFECLEGLEYYWNHCGGEAEIESVQLFCTPSDAHNDRMLKRLSIGSATRGGKPIVVCHDREFSGVVYQRYMHSASPIVELHANLWGSTNAGNYKSLEALKSRIPFVHNSTLLRGLGYYYAANDWRGMVAAIRDAANNHAVNYLAQAAAAEEFLRANCYPESEAVWRPTAQALTAAATLVQVDCDEQDRAEDERITAAAAAAEKK
jgi:hypothetical protein